MGAATFRRFDATRPSVAEFYRQNHREQTLDFVLAKKPEYLRDLVDEFLPRPLPW
jgi:hypothetical protein